MWVCEASENNFNPGLKLHNAFQNSHSMGMDGTAAFDLLNALQWSPNMQVLVLEGLPDAELEES